MDISRRCCHVMSASGPDEYKRCSNRIDLVTKRRLHRGRTASTQIDAGTEKRDRFLAEA